MWFGNVERVASERIGRETVTYVSNIYKYYITYRLLTEQRERRDAAKAEVGKRNEHATALSQCANHGHSVRGIKTLGRTRAHQPQFSKAKGQPMESTNSQSTIAMRAQRILLASALSLSIRWPGSTRSSPRTQSRR